MQQFGLLLVFGLILFKVSKRFIHRSNLTVLVSWSIHWWAVFSTTSGGSLGCHYTSSTCSYTCCLLSSWQFSHYLCWLLKTKYV